MRIFFVIIACIFVIHLAHGQNLVDNGGFEEKAYCPSNFNQASLNILTYWRQATRGTPDYFNACSRAVGVPDNLFGSQPAFEGEGYIGLVTFTATKPNYREYLQIKLDHPLRAGEKICVEVHLSPAEKAAYVTDGFGLAFTKEQPKSSSQKVLNLSPQLKNPRLHLIDEGDYWTKISEMFVAEGGEEFLTIGNFSFDSELTILKKNHGSGKNEANDWAYVYVDNVVVKRVEEREECSCVNDLIAEQIHDPPLQLGEVKELEMSTILFEFDDTAISDEGKRELERIIKVMDARKISFMEIIGHTDLMGKEDYNFDLSKERAKAVIDYMVDKGVDPHRLHISWRGEKDPLIDAHTADEMAINRRVEFKILEYKYEEIHVKKRP